MTTDQAAAGLTDEQAAILDFERAWWKYSGAKDTAIRDAFDISSTQYYQRLNAVIDLPAALPHDPLLVRRLTRLREARRDVRTAR
jgi:hypothetical protein